jgi:hypothetical protein
MDQDEQWMVLLPAQYLVGLLRDRNERFDFSDSPFVVA